ncbi:MAG: hypothetical protein JWQ27_3303 [Ferruginibacter sp.]|nr:hypothetical protein [Ferruginibacter sp.]
MKYDKKGLMAWALAVISPVYVKYYSTLAESLFLL